MKKILFIHHAIGWGGAPKAMINLIKTLDNSKYQVEVLLIKDSIVSSKLKENGISFSIAKSKFYKKFYFGFIHSEAGYYKWYQIYYILKSTLFWLLSRYYFAKKELNNHEFEIVHLNSSIMSDWIAPAKSKGKVIIHIREPFRRGRLDIFHYIFTNQMRKYADKIISISIDNAVRIGVPNKTETVYDYSELINFNPKIESYFSKKVLYLGGAAAIKGFYEIVESLKYLDENIIVYFGGSYESGASHHSIISTIRYLLFKEYKIIKAIKVMRKYHNLVEIGLTYDVPKYLDEVCCLVSPFSKPHFSLPVIEAFAHQKPVIVTDIEGANEVVMHMYNGIIVKKKNPKELAKAINYICNNGHLAQELGKNGFSDVQNKFSITNMNKIAAIYDSL